MSEEKLSFREKLDRVSELEDKIAKVAKPIYEEWHNLVSETIVDFINKKSSVMARKGESLSGLITAPLRIKFKDGIIFELRPGYMSKEGSFRNTVFKAVGPEMFTIKKITPDPDLPF